MNQPKEEPETAINKAEKLENDFQEIPSEAVDTLKASVLYNAKKPEEKPMFKEYIPTNATPQEVRDILADKKQVDRNFWGYKGNIKKLIKKSKDPQTAIENLNILLNANDKKLNASTVTNILNLTEAVNNERADAKFIQLHYGFQGGKLTNENIDKFNETLRKDFAIAMFASMAAANDPMTGLVLQQQMMTNDLLQQQTFTNNMLQQEQQQMIINQQMMGM